MVFSVHGPELSSLCTQRHGVGVGEASTLEVLALCPERQGSFLHSRLARHPAVLKQRHSVNLVGLGRGLGTGEWGRFLLSPPTVCLFVRPVRQQLLFLNSPFSVMESLVGLVGEMPFRTCMLYRSFTWVSALISLVLAESRDTIRFSYNTPNGALFWLHVGNCAVMLYQMTVLINAFYQTAVHMMLPRQMERLCLFLHPSQASFPWAQWVCVSFSPSALQGLLLITPWDPKTSHKNDTMCYSDYETEVSSCFAVVSALGQNLNTGIRWQRKKHQRFHFTEEKCMWSMGSQPPKGAHRSHVERFHVVLKTETVHGGSL